jgi:hypothetical protein
VVVVVVMKMLAVVVALADIEQILEHPAAKLLPNQRCLSF